MSSLTACGGGNNGGKSEEGGDGIEKGDYSVLVWVDTKIKAITESQLAAFKSTLPEGVNVTFEIKAVGEGTAAGNMLTDPEKGADIYGFAQDQLARLVAGNALSPISGQIRTEVESRNSEDSVNAAKSGRAMYAFPLTDNGYFLYYDKSVISESQAGNVTSLLAACTAAGKTFSYAADDAWYNAAYFFGAGCKSEWKTNASGKFTEYDDTYNSDEGLMAAKGIKELVLHAAYAPGSEAGTALGSGSAAVVSGTWDYNAAKEKLGDNFAAIELPSFTVDGVTKHLGSFNGYKLIGVKPQANASKAAICQMAASYITNKDCQLARFEQNGWGPTNKEALELDDIKNNEALNALHNQAKFATPQGQYPSKWWNHAAAISSDIKLLGASSTDAQLREILQAYADGLEDFLG